MTTATTETQRWSAAFEKLVGPFGITAAALFTGLRRLPDCPSSGCTVGRPCVGWCLLRPTVGGNVTCERGGSRRTARDGRGRSRQSRSCQATLRE